MFITRVTIILVQDKISFKKILMSPSLTESISEFAVKSDFNHLPSEAIPMAKDAILDFLCVAIAGTTDVGFRIASEFAEHLQSVQEATVICRDFKTSVDWAALLNSMAGHAAQGDVSFPSSTGFALHPGAAILPAVLALGEKQRISGKKILTAYCIAIEVLLRLGKEIGVNNLEAGWHPTSVLGAIGATLSCCSISGLSVVQTKTALGIASSLTGGFKRNFGTMAKDFNVGNSARNGIIAAELARAGLTADNAILDGPGGLLHTFSPGFVGSPVFHDLGIHWNILNTGLSFKPYPCSRGAHAAVDAVLTIKRNVKFTEKDAVEIVCKTSSEIRAVMRYHCPSTGKEAKFSMEYCIAVALKKGKIIPSDFMDTELKDLGIQKLMEKVHYPESPEWPRGLDAAQEITITLKDGRTFSHKNSVPKGEPENPMKHEDIVGKFMDFTSSIIASERCERILEIMEVFETLEDISAIAKLFS
ncbi:MAG: MmgE/PrpD family protein [Deltaproteobacteria bacterium]|nr:MmgE/PrpD family protein [Deltaproteobacteria bacterium]